MGMKIKPYIDLSSQAATNLLGKVKAGIKSPEQRLIIGTTAFLTIPAIEATNPNANEDQRTLAISKAFAKIIACTLSGFAVRKVCNKIIKKYVMKKNSILNPTEFAKDLDETIKTKRIPNFSNTIGTFAASFVMLFTNYIWDAPVTKHLTNFFYKAATHRKERG